MKSLYVFLLVLFGAGAMAQEPAPQILWSKKKLKWKDFVAMPDSSSKSVFNINIRLETEYYIDSVKQVHFLIAAWFVPEYSWVKVDKKTDYSLNHAQVYFNLGELYARKIRKLLINLPFYDSTVKKEVPKLFKQFRDELTKQRKKMGEDIAFGRNGKKLDDWDFSITGEMKELDAYQQIEVVVKLKDE